MLLRALVVQETDAVADHARAVGCAAQAIRPLRAVNKMSRALLAEPSRNLHTDNPALDTDAARATVLQ